MGCFCILLNNSVSLHTTKVQGKWMYNSTHSFNLGTTWCVVRLTTWRLFPRQKNAVDVQEVKRRSCICNNMVQRHTGNRSFRYWIGDGCTHLRSSRFIPITINDACFTVGCLGQTYSGGGGEEKHFASDENRVTSLQLVTSLNRVNDKFCERIS